MFNTACQQGSTLLHRVWNILRVSVQYKNIRKHLFLNNWLTDDLFTPQPHRLTDWLIDWIDWLIDWSITRYDDNDNNNNYYYYYYYYYYNSPDLM